MNFQGHQHNLLEIEADKMRKNMVMSIEKLKKLMEDITETSRKLEVTQQVNKLSSIHSLILVLIDPACISDNGVSR